MEFVSTTPNQSPELGSDGEAQSPIELLEFLNEGILEPSQAIAFAEKKLQGGKNSSGWYLPIGLAYWKVADYSQAWKALHKVNDNSVKDSTFYSLLGMVGRRIPEHLDDAISAYKQAILLGPDPNTTTFSRSVDLLSL